MRTERQKFENNSLKKFFMEDFYNTPPTFLILVYQKLRVSKLLKHNDVCSWSQIIVILIRAYT